MQKRVTLALATLAFPVSAALLHLDQLDALLAESGADSVASFLGAKKLPDPMLSNFVPVKKSPSLQPSTLTEPRILLFSDDGELVFTFNDGVTPGRDEHKQSHHHFEVMKWNRTAENFEFYSIAFSPGEKPAYKIVGPNPEECIACHPNGQPTLPPARAIPSLKEIETFVLEKCQGQGPEGRAAKGFENYRHLDCERIVEQWRKAGDTPDQRLFRVLRALDDRRFAAILARSPDFDRFKYATLAALSDCPNMDAMVPETAGLEAVKPLKERVAEALATFGPTRPGEPADRVAYQRSQLSSLGKLRYLYLNRGIDMKGWSLQEVLISSPPFESGLTARIPALLAKEPTLGAAPLEALRTASGLGSKPLPSPIEVGAIGEFCVSLERESRKALADFRMDGGAR